MTELIRKYLTELIMRRMDEVTRRYYQQGSMTAQEFQQEMRLLEAARNFVERHTREEEEVSGQ